MCIDPWLLEHRTCPMCKLDILKHYGFVVSANQAINVYNYDPMIMISSSPSSSITNTTSTTTTANTASSSPSSSASQTNSSANSQINNCSMNNVVTSNSNSVSNNVCSSNTTTITVNNDNTVSVNVEQISECPDVMSDSTSSQTNFSLLADQRPQKTVTESRQITDV